MFGAADHWTRGLGSQGRADRQHQVRVANAVLGPHGLRCAEWQGRFTLTGPTGRQAVVAHLGALWPEAERLAGKPLDPLDPALLARMER